MKTKSFQKTSAIDLGLAVLSAIRRPHQCFTQQAIAAACGCSRQNIYDIEHKAIRRARRIFRRDWNLTRDQLAALKNFTP